MKETHYKLKHRVTALFAAAVMLCSMLPGAAFAEGPTPQPTEETVQMEQQTEPSETDNGQADESSPDPGAATEENAVPTADEQAEEKEPYTFDGEVLYQDMPDAPTGSYLGSYGLPVATGETKIGLGAWDADLEQDSYLSAEALDSDNHTLATPLLEDTDYAIVPILAQVEYPTDGSTVDLVLPDGVTLLDYYGEPAKDAESLLHSEYSETSAVALGVYVQADADFTAQLVYTAPDGSTQTKTLYVTIDREHTVASPFADAGIAAYGERPIPDVTSGKITKVAKVNGTWLIWFNGEPAYCCTHGANGQPAGCPTYTYVNTSTVGADQCIPGDHYGNQIRIWGGLNQLSLGDADDLPAVFSADEGEEISLLDFCASIYDDVQMYIIENFPESTAAEIYLASADEMLNGVETYASARGYYTYIYNPGRAGWQTVALIGPEIGEEEPAPEPVVQEYYASWEAPAQTASGSFDFSYGISTDKIQLKTQEKVDGATIEIEPITKSGSIEGGSWSISPAGKQTVTTSGHTADDNYQKNGGDAGASWSLHYAVTKTSGTRNGQVGPFTTQEAADAAANSARDTAIRAADGYALADNITFRLIQKTDEGGNPLEECQVYYLTTKNILFWKWDDWRLLDDATVIMRDDITKVQISKKDLTTKEELHGAELTLTDEKGNEIDRWVSTDAPHYMERLPAGKYTLTEVTAPDGYAIAERMEFEVLPNGEVQTFEMFDDTIKVKISKVDITTNEELPGAELVIKDKDGTEIDRWISTNGPHYVEKMPAGDYTLTEITAPNGYKVAESIDFTVLPTGEMQTVVMKDAREDTPTPDHTPQPTPNTTPAPAAPTAPPTPLLTIPKTGDNSPLGLLLAIAGISLAGLAVLVHKSARRKELAPRTDEDNDTEE